MKKRIIALILVVVMSVLTLASCGSFNFVKEDLSAYATFDYEAFKTALKNIEIEDGEFTTNEETRAKLVAAKIYNAVADKIIAAAKDGDKLKEGELQAGDILYFVYFAQDADGNVYNGSDMGISSITASSTKANHVLRLDDYLEGEDDEFLRLVRDSLEQINIADRLYVVKTNTELEEEYDEQFKAEHDGKDYADAEKAFENEYKTNNPDATEDQVKEAVAAFKKEYEDGKKNATKVKEGDILYISYTVKHKVPVKGKDGDKVDADGNKLDENGNIIYTTVTEKASYEMIKVDASNPLHAKFLEADAVAKYGSTFEAFVSKDDAGKVTTSKSFKITVDGVEYEYTSLKFDWKVESEPNYMGSFTYVPYKTEDFKKDDDTVDKKEVAPNFTIKDGKAYPVVDGTKVDLVGKDLTYYVFPVYAIHAPSSEEITVTDILYHVYGSKLTSSSFEILEEEYKNGDETLEDLLKEITEIFDTKSTTNDYYKEGGSLYDLNKAYNDAVKAGGSKPSTAQQETIDNAKEVLTDKQNEFLKATIEKIVAAKNGDKVLGDEIYKYDAEADVKMSGEYYKDNYHTLKETYDSDITKKVQTEVWDLINDSVKLTGKYPENLLKEYKDHLYESYEYKFYKGTYTPAGSSSSSSSATQSNYDHYEGSFDRYLIDTLKLSTKAKLVKSELDAALEKEAKSFIDPIIKIYVVAKACNNDALAVLKSYVQADIDGGAYNVHRDDFDVYGDRAEEKYNEAVKNAEESKKSSLDEAKYFLITDEFMNNYKKDIGAASYDSVVAQYGEINLRAGFQFNKLFYYLTSTNVELNEDGDHTETIYKDGKLDFRTVTYIIVEDADSDSDSDHDHDH